MSNTYLLGIESLPSTSQLTTSSTNTRLSLAAVASLFVGVTPLAAHAQVSTLPMSSSSVVSAAVSVVPDGALADESALDVSGKDISMPDSPGFTAISSSEAQGASVQTRASSGPEANRFDKTIEPGQIAPRLTVGDKVLLGIRENVSFTSLAGWVISAGYEQAANNSPNYGQTGKGFAQRLGAAAARNSSENIFSDSIIAPILHQDPRYYRMGARHSFVSRLFYSGTRGLIGRTDGGHQTINFANIGGDLGGSALTQLYYPPLNRSFDQVMQTWGSSIGGDAVGYVVSEFLPNVLSVLHLGKADQ